MVNDEKIIKIYRENKFRPLAAMFFYVSWQLEQSW